jgi:hypothetical protein
MNNEGAIVPLFLTYEQLQESQQRITAIYEAERAEALEVYKAEIAAIDRVEAEDLPRLKKSAEISEFSKALRDAKDLADIARILKPPTLSTETPYQAKHRALLDARLDALATLDEARKVALKKRNVAVSGHNAHAERSHRFAKAHSRPYYGPGATLLKMEPRP